MDLTTGQLRALRLAAWQPARQNSPDRIENNVHGRQYVAELMELGLVAWYPSDGVKRHTIEITPAGVAVVHEYWVTGKTTLTHEQIQAQRVDTPPSGG